MVSLRKNTRKRVSFRGENNEKIASEPEEDASQAADNLAENSAQSSQGSFVIYALIYNASTQFCIMKRTPPSEILISILHAIVLCPLIPAEIIKF